MAYYHVFLHSGIRGQVEVSPAGIIIDANAGVFQKAIGLRFARFSLWVKSKEGEIFPAKEPPIEPKEKLSW
jgi:hypothetical protein